MAATTMFMKAVRSCAFQKLNFDWAFGAGPTSSGVNELRSSCIEAAGGRVGAFSAFGSFADSLEHPAKTTSGTAIKAIRNVRRILVLMSVSLLLAVAWRCEACVYDPQSVHCTLDAIAGRPGAVV
jgi:hypothetical protein